MTDLSFQGLEQQGAPPMAQPGVEQKPFTAKTVREAWDRGMKATRQERQTASLNQCFILNQHWNYWNKSSGRLEEMPRNPDRVRATIAKIGPDSGRILAKLTSRPLAWEVAPQSADDSAIQASRIAEAGLAETARSQGWEEMRYEHAEVTWTAGVGAIAVEWDDSVGTTIGITEDGREVKTGDVKLTVVALHEIACEPGTRDIRTARWWVRGVAMPPETAKEEFGLDKKPPADARMADSVWRSQDSDRSAEVPMTMVFTYFERPTNGSPGRVATIVGDEVVKEGPWPFPWTDKLNIGVCKVKPIHGKWFGHTPVTDAVPVQAAFNASWSSIIEHMKQAGNARLWVPYGTVEDIEDLSDLAGEAALYNPINGMRPMYESPPSMPDWWIRQPDMLGAQMDNILGQKEVSRGGAPAGVESGLALSILSENDDTMIGRFGRNMADMWGEVASMVLKLYEQNVRETRNAMVKMPNARIPEVVQWNGEKLQGHTTAYVPTDAVQPRNRSAQQAYAFQLYDRGIIKTPQELAKVADLPDSDDLLNGIDPDTARASRENASLSSGQARTVDVIDDHQNHIFLHRNFMRSERYEQLPQQIQELIRKHVAAHEMYAAQQASQQAYAAGISPLAAALPTEATSVLTQDQVGAQAMMSQMAPAGEMSGMVAPGMNDMAGPPQQGMGMEMPPEMLEGEMMPEDEMLAAEPGPNAEP